MSIVTTESHNCLLLSDSSFAKLRSIFLLIVEKNSLILIQCCTNRRRQVFQTTKFCTEPPSFVNLFHITSSAPRIETASAFLSNLFNPGLMTCTFCYNFAPRGFEVFSILSFQVSCHHFLYTRLPSTGGCYSRPIGDHSTKELSPCHELTSDAMHVNVILRCVRVTVPSVEKQ